MTGSPIDPTIHVGIVRRKAQNVVERAEEFDPESREKANIEGLGFSNHS